MSDQNDLTRNIAIYDEAGVKNVSVITDGLIERLACEVSGDISISGDESPTKYQARFAFDAVGVTLNTITDTSLITVTTIGLLDFIGIGGSNSNFIVVLKIDGVERLRVSTSELAAIGLQNTTTSPIWVETADKNFRFNPANGAGFSTSYEVLARSTGAPNPNVKVFTTYREKI